MTIKFIDDDLTAIITNDEGDESGILYIDDFTDDELLVTIERHGKPQGPGVRIPLDDLIEAAANFAGR